MGGGRSRVAVKLQGTRWANEWAGVIFKWAERWGARWAKRKGGGRMGWLSSIGCEVGPKEWPGIIFKWVVAAVGWLSSFRVRGGAKRMGGGRIRMGGGRLG